ncbi:MAG: FecR domain-containing protein [Bacteroidota bacterium]
MDENRYLDLMAKQLAGEISPGELAELSKWMDQQDEHQNLFEEVSEVWAITENFDADFGTIDMTKAWEQIEEGIAGSADVVALSDRKPRWSIGQQLLRIAAVFLVVSGLGYVGYQFLQAPEAEPILVETTTNTQTIILPDGSEVWLNQSSQLSYLPDFEERHVELTGEAFFDVTHREGKTFEIFSGDLKTIVLGTSFNVRAYPEEGQIEVTVESGRVKVEQQLQTTSSNKPAAPKAIQLEKGNKGVFVKSSKVLEKSQEINQNESAWKTKKIIFDNTPFRDVVQTLERYFDVQIKVDDPAAYNCAVSIDEFENPSLKEVTDLLDYILGFKVEKQADYYLIKGACPDKTN